jgi:hypothetical protein
VLHQEIDITQSADNLLINCAELKAGHKLLILCEPSEWNFYDCSMSLDVAARAQALGVECKVIRIPFNSVVTGPCDMVSAEMAAADCTIFMARMGDQLRFHSALKQRKSVVCYAPDRPMMASGFGVLDYNAFVDLRDVLNDAVFAAEHVHVSCPAGTDFAGVVGRQVAASDVRAKRFPMSIFAPVPAWGFSGRVAQRGFLVGTGSQYYEPYACGLDETLFVAFEANRIVDFSGSAEDVRRAREHYVFVADRYTIDWDFVHSWHAGMHPACGFGAPAQQNFERWSGAAFGNPRLLHLHTCGAYAPGEISLNVLDPTITLDGVAVWDNGVLHPDRVAGGAEILAQYPDVAAAFAHPVTAGGQGPNGLSFV